MSRPKPSTEFVVDGEAPVIDHEVVVLVAVYDVFRVKPNASETEVGRNIESYCVAGGVCALTSVFVRTTPPLQSHVCDVWRTMPFTVVDEEVGTSPLHDPSYPILVTCPLGAWIAVVVPFPFGFGV